MRRRTHKSRGSREQSEGIGCRGKTALSDAGEAGPLLMLIYTSYAGKETIGRAISACSERESRCVGSRVGAPGRILLVRGSARPRHRRLTGRGHACSSLAGVFSRSALRQCSIEFSMAPSRWLSFRAAAEKALDGVLAPPARTLKRGFRRLSATQHFGSLSFRCHTSWGNSVSSRALGNPILQLAQVDVRGIMHCMSDMAPITAECA